MKVLAQVHMYVPYHNAGAELMLHTLLRHLVQQGHEVRVLSARNLVGKYVHEGVTCSRPQGPQEAGSWYRWADVAITHLDQTAQAMVHARKHGKPLVHIVHNERQLSFHRVQPEAAQLVIFNSRWIAEKVAWPGRSIIIRPPVVAGDYQTTRGESYTLVNMSPSKGGDLFYELARRLSERQFLGVLGSYGRQVRKPRPANMRIVDNTPNMRAVYAQTRVLLMPSDYESWGRVAIEAAASGIPTIAHPTPGLRESLGDAGIFADRAAVDAWVAQLQALEEPETYLRQSKLSLKRSAELDPMPELELFERSLQELIV